MVIQITAPASIASVASVMSATHGPDFEGRFGRKLVDSIDDVATIAVTASVDAVPASSIIVHLDPPVLWGLCTVPAQREKGLASQVIDFALAEIERRRPGMPVFTAVAKDGVWVRESYEKRGFRVQHDNVIQDHLLLIRGELPGRPTAHPVPR